MKEDLTFSYGWERVNDHSFAFQNPKSNCVAFILPQNNILSRVPLISKISNKSKYPWKFACVDNNKGEILIEEGCSSKEIAISQLTEYLEENRID